MCSKCISKYLSFRPGTGSRLPSGLPGESEKGSFRGRIRLAGVWTFVSANEFINRINAATSEWASRYKYDWKIEEAQKNILRTHTTAVSARMLYKLAQQVGELTSFVHFNSHQDESCRCECRNWKMKDKAELTKSFVAFPVKKDFGFCF